MSLVTLEEVRNMRSALASQPMKAKMMEMMVTLQLAAVAKMNKEMMEEIKLQLDDWEEKLENEEKEKEEKKRKDEEMKGGEVVEKEKEEKERKDKEMKVVKEKMRDEMKQEKKRKEKQLSDSK